MTLRGRNAVVTGGGRGIGAAIARALAGAGAGVVVCARTESEVEAVAADLASHGRNAHALRCDVTDPDDVARMAEAAIERLGSVDVLVCNAGYATAAPVERIALEDWDRALAVNATGPFLCARALVPAMVERKWGRIVTIASVAACAGAPYVAAYSASKHAALGLMRCLAAEVAESGVTANAVCPGYVDSDMTVETIARIVERTGRSEAEAREAIVSQTPQRRLIQPHEVAHAVLSLCEEGGRGINGQAIVLDGGGLLA